jgi:hypothetical protein
VVFGEGEIPANVPKDFPMPEGGVIGSTLVDHINHKTEFSIQLSQDLETVAKYYDVELVNQGYVVTSSQPLSDTLYRIEFNSGELTGQVTVNSVGGVLDANPIVQVVVTLNIS